VQRSLLALAEDRDEALRKQITAGSVPPVEGLDNRRAILDRAARIVAAERALQQAAFDLARHLRDADGEVSGAGAGALPEAFPEPQRPAGDVPEAMIQEAFARRPDLRRLLLQREAASVELKLARNNRSRGSTSTPTPRRMSARRPGLRVPAAGRVRRRRQRRAAAGAAQRPRASCAAPGRSRPHRRRAAHGP
jgi:hypothetical protein